MKKTEPPKRLRKGHRRCTQIRCAFYQQGSCQSCESCKARPYEINTECVRCLNCESVENDLRWGDKKIENKNDNKKSVKIVLMVDDKPVAVIGEDGIKKPVRREEKPIVR